MSDNDKDSTEPEAQPYPGLRFYSKDLANVFAGREREVEDCVAELIPSAILILHGRTGCGKSSFLRAGVKPKLERSGLAIQFEESPKGFEVIRSTRYPLRELAKKVEASASDLLRRMKNPRSAKGASFGEPRRHFDPDQLARLEEILKTDRLIDEICEDGNILLDLMSLIGLLLKSAPIFVIDQAEEVFTLTSVGNAGNEDSKSEESGDPSLQAAQSEEEFFQAELLAYFRFLKTFAASDCRCKLVISLRTEYKGLFDDRVSKEGHPGDQIRGYYLNDLGKDGLTEAIKRPTLQKAEWEALPVAQLPDISYQNFGFFFDDEVVEQLVAELLSDKVPAGGVLPTLQVACLRLWRLAKASQKGGGRRFRVTINHFQQLGGIQDQIEEYLAQCLEECCANVGEWPTADMRRTISDRWHEVLNTSLVTVEADGRAVTRSIPMDRLVDRAIKLIGKVTKASVEDLVNRIASDEIGILRKDERDEQSHWTLGHDSLALALNKWNVKFGQKDMGMMRMGMSSVGSPDAYEMSDLFPKAADQPHLVTLVVQQDFAWDHQLPMFAAKKGFAARLGISIETDDRLKAKNLKNSKGEIDWPALRQTLVDKDAQLETHRVKGKNNDRVLIINDWNNFPGTTDYRPRKSRKDGLKKFEINKNIWRWSDVLVSDMFYGNGLIGEGVGWHKKVSEAEKIASESMDRGVVELLEVVADALREVRESRGIIKCHDRIGYQFLQFAAKLVGDSEFEKYIQSKSNVSITQNLDYQAYDQLLSWMLEDSGDEENPRPKYIVGTAQSRTLALHAGLSVYFGTNHLATIARNVISHRKKSGSREDRLEHLSNLAEEVQGIVTHTLWQLGVPAGQWNTGINRPTVLRLASIGYYTSEYVRTNANEFVMHLHEFLNDVFRNIGGVDKAGKDMRISRSALRKTWQDCFSIARFDEAGAESYDPDSIYAFQPQHGNYASKSVAAEVYAELMSLRARTIEHFSSLSGTIAWLNARANDGKMDKGARKSRSKNLWEAYRYRESAWKNYRIFNFYDSERLMAQAAQIMQRELEYVSSLESSAE